MRQNQDERQQGGGAAIDPPSGAAARNHHYVPQCYLRGFARSRSKNAQLFVVDLARGKSFPTTPRNVGAQRDFNRIELPGQDPNLVESAFAEFECKLAPALGRIEEHRDFASEYDKAAVLELIVLLATRNPGFREARRQAFAQMARIINSMLVSTPERYESQMRQARNAGYIKEDPVPYEQMRNFLQEERYTVEVPSTSHVATEMKLLDHMRKLIGGRGWTLLRAPAQGPGFVTCDHPVVLTWDDPDKVRHPPGFAHVSTSIVFPISRHYAFFGKFDRPDGRPIDIDEKGVATLNTNVILHAQQQVYAESERFLFLDGTSAIHRGQDLLTVLPRDRQSTAQARGEGKRK
ncbi:DUF4238 domain-containing protein [Cupriavidus taiwanensis]|uniref:DUF4238 domain-containing protein n=1 Tax=Cupriavidus taiwanensis TaxID=164546 RepID=UPI0025420D23|nr:DUF4238 domain-containing protein [Cupriavidus taiwanensis]MDK3022630.1 DUF4238 domain-containing protein [Cupriavidus taiwanensis]